MGERRRYLTSLEDSARWDRFELRAGDIVVSTPGKCGTTWAQMICALLVHQTATLPAPLHELSPWLDAHDAPIEEIVDRLAAQPHRRVIKTHTPLDGLPDVNGVTYVGCGRDPRDVARSARDHLQNTDWDAIAPDARPPAADLSEEAFFWWWVEVDAPITSVPVGLRRLAHHLHDFWERRDDDRFVLLHYVDLADDLEGQMRSLAERLDVDVPAARWPVLVDAATFASMRSSSDTTAPGQQWHDKQSFFKAARRGSWHHLLATDDARARYHARAAALLDPTLSAWAHRA